MQCSQIDMTYIWRSFNFHLNISKCEDDRFKWLSLSGCFICVVATLMMVFNYS